MVSLLDCIHTCASVFALLSRDSSGAMVAVFLVSVRIVATVAFLDSVNQWKELTICIHTYMPGYPKLTLISKSLDLSLWLL